MAHQVTEYQSQNGLLYATLQLAQAADAVFLAAYIQTYVAGKLLTDPAGLVTVLPGMASSPNGIIPLDTNTLANSLGANHTGWNTLNTQIATWISAATTQYNGIYGGQ